jgi:hypothetical protein
MSTPVKVNTAVGSVWFNLMAPTRKLIVSTSTADGPVRINNIACSIHLTYRMSGKSLRPMTMEAYTHPKHELIPGSLAQKIAQLILPAAIQWLAMQKVPSLA